MCGNRTRFRVPTTAMSSEFSMGTAGRHCCKETAALAFSSTSTSTYAAKGGGLEECSDLTLGVSPLLRRLRILFKLSVVSSSSSLPHRSMQTMLSGEGRLLIGFISLSWLQSLFLLRSTTTKNDPIFTVDILSAETLLTGAIMAPEVF